MSLLPWTVKVTIEGMVLRVRKVYWMTREVEGLTSSTEVALKLSPSEDLDDICDLFPLSVKFVVVGTEIHELDK